MISLNRLAALALTAVFAAGVARAASEDWQPVEAVAAAVSRLIEAESGDGRLRVETIGLDGRLRLPRCDVPLAAQLHNGAPLTRSGTVAVRCDGSKPWRIYVPVRVSRHRPVVGTVRPLPAGHVLGPDDLALAEHDTSRLARGYFMSPDQIVGKELRRSVGAGTLLTPGMLVEPMAIRRGQSVTILARGASVSVSMGGTALADGAIGERIRVRNLSSARVVEAVVRSAETVEVLLY